MKQIYPWESGPPLLTLLRAGEEDLPDESFSFPGASGLVRFVSGAADGITLYNGPLEEPLPSSEVVPRVLFALARLLTRATPSRRLALALREEDDEELREKLQALSRDLMRSSPAGRRG